MRILTGFFGIGIVLGLVAAFQTFAHGQIVTDASDRVPWGIGIAAYTFFMGASAGSFLIGALPLFGGRRYEQVAPISLLQALVWLCVAPLFLLVDMGRPERFALIYLSPNPTSVLAWGAYALPLYAVACAAYGFGLIRERRQATPGVWREKRDRFLSFWGWSGVALAIFVGTYSGVLLGLARGRPLWNTALMPVLFFTSALLSGSALAVLSLTVWNRWNSPKIDKSSIHFLGKIMFVLLGVDVFFLACEFLIATYVRGSKHGEAWMVFFKGIGGWMFLGVELLLGVMVPVWLLVRRPATPRSLSAAAAWILLGVFAMRCNMILGGQVVQAYGGPEGSYFPTLHEWMFAVGVVSLGGMLSLVGGRFLLHFSRIGPHGHREGVAP